MTTTLKDKKTPTRRKSVPSRPKSPAAVPETDAPRPVWQIVAEIGAEIPDDEWAEMPDDGSVNYKHLLYGAPRQNA